MGNQCDLNRYLCHESCDRTGNVYEVGGGWIAQVRWERSRGVVFPPSNEMTLEGIRSQINNIEVPTYLYASFVPNVYLTTQNFSIEPKAYPTSLQDSLNHIKTLFA